MSWPVCSVLEVLCHGLCVVYWRFYVVACV